MNNISIFYKKNIVLIVWLYENLTVQYFPGTIICIDCTLETTKVPKSPRYMSPKS
jgi:hypothetical protein